nr:isoform 2 of phosphatidylinositol-3-phosphatase myotubularin-1 [Quercus suber]
MAAPPRQRSGGGRTTSLRGDTSESDKLESTTSWDVLEWTKIEPDSRYVSHVKFDFLLEAEQVIVEGYGVVLVNTDEAGTLIVTNFRLIFLVIKAQSAPRQFDKTPSRRLLQVIGKDMRIIVFGFRPRTKQRRAVFEALLQCTKPASLWDLYAFTSGSSKFKNSNPKERLLMEYFRLLGKGSFRPSIDMIENGSFTFSNDFWRISSINSNYAMCQSYPFALIVPKGISDEEVLQASTFRARCRLPVVSWCHPRSGAVLARSSQPLVGLMMNMRSNTDEKLVAALCTQLASVRGARRSGRNQSELQNPVSKQKMLSEVSASLPGPATLEGSEQDGTLVGLLAFSGLEPTGPLRLEVGESPTGGDPKLLRQEAHAPVMSKASHFTSKA